MLRLDLKEPDKFLIIQTAFIGDAILATAVLEKLHLFFPNAQISILVREGNQSLFQNHPFLHSCLVWNKKKRKYANLFRLLRQIRRSKYDKVINLQRFAASGFLTAFSKAKERIGFSKNPFSFLFDKKLPHIISENPDESVHEVNRNLSLIAHLTNQESVMPALYPSDGDQQIILPYIGENFITISPASVWFTKQTPIGIWKMLLDQLTNTKIYILGSATDIVLCEELLLHSSDKVMINLAGKLSLLQSAALMKRAVMNYTNDSAPMHLCSAMNAPVTAVYCSTVPAFGFGPLSTNATVVETKLTLPCKPCGLHGYAACPRGHFKCAIIDINDLTAPLEIT